MAKHESRPGPRVAIVTGAGAGLGRAYARRLAADGLRVIVNNRRREVDAAGRGSADLVVDEIIAAGGEAVANYEDVCAAGAGERMVEQARGTWGRLDALVNNAGVDQHATFHKIDLETFRHIFDVNFLGTLQVTHAAWQHMRAAGHGRVLVSTSSAGLHGLHGLSAYAAAITDDATRAAMSPDYVAPLVSALVSERSRVNGQVIVTGGGWARRCATVEADSLVYVGPGAAADASAQLQAEPWRIAAVCREFRDGRESYEEFFSRIVGDLRQA
jgi:NADP-dependent 3-hydroxy acid dehydrogenase YdfG